MRRLRGNFFGISATIVFSWFAGMGATGINFSNITSKILLPESDQFMDYFFARNLYWSGDFLVMPNVGSLNGGTIAYPIPILFDFRKWAILYPITKFFGEPVLAVNVSLISSFVFVALSMYLLLNYLKVEKLLSFVLGIAFSFLPWHILRLVHGFSFADYSVVPAVLFLIVYAFRRLNSGSVIPIKRNEIYALVFAAFWIATSGTYYIFFSLILFTISFLVSGFLIGKQSIMARKSFTYHSIILIGMGFTLFAQFIFWRINSPNSTPLAPAVKDPTETLQYSLLLFTLVIPILSYPNTGLLSKLPDAVNNWRSNSFCLPDHTKNSLTDLTCSVNFESSAYVSLIMGILFCYSTYIAFGYIAKNLNFDSANLRKVVSGNPDKSKRINAHLSGIPEDYLLQKLLALVLFISMFFATIGGGGFLFTLIYANFRAQGRFSVFILGVVILIAGLELNKKLSVKRGRTYPIFIFLILGCIILNSRIFIPGFNSYNSISESMLSHVNKVEKSVHGSCSFLVVPIISNFSPFTDISNRIHGQFPYENAMLYAMSHKIKFDANISRNYLDNNAQLNSYFNASTPVDMGKKIMKNYCGLTVFSLNNDESSELIQWLKSNTELIAKSDYYIQTADKGPISHTISTFKFR